MTLKFGKLPPINKPALKFGDFLKAIPDHPLVENYLEHLSDWKMLGNDQYGDCVAVGWANIRRLYTAFLTAEGYPSEQMVYEVYKTQNPNFPYEDNGMVIQTMLEYLNKNGYQCIKF